MARKICHLAGLASGVVGIEEAEVRFLAANDWVSLTLGKVNAAALVLANGRVRSPRVRSGNDPAWCPAPP